MSDEFHQCSKDASTVTKHAKCVSKLLRDEYPTAKRPNFSFHLQATRKHLTKTGESKVKPTEAFVTEHDTRSTSSPSKRLRNRFPSVSGLNLKKHSFSRFEKFRYRPKITKAQVNRSDFRHMSFRRYKRDLASNAFENRFRVISKNQYELSGGDRGLSPFGIVAKMLKKSMLVAKNKTDGAK